MSFILFQKCPAYHNERSKYINKRWKVIKFITKVKYRFIMKQGKTRKLYVDISCRINVDLTQRTHDALMTSNWRRCNLMSRTDISETSYRCCVSAEKDHIFVSQILPSHITYSDTYECLPLFRVCIKCHYQFSFFLFFCR